MLFVFRGAVRVLVYRTTFTVATGGFFLVPRGASALLTSQTDFKADCEIAQATRTKLRTSGWTMLRWSSCKRAKCGWSRTPTPLSMLATSVTFYIPLRHTDTSQCNCTLVYSSSWRALTGMRTSCSGNSCVNVDLDEVSRSASVAAIISAKASNREW